MPARVFVSLFLILILAVACVPMTTSPAATSPATSEGPATPEGPLPPVAAPTAEPTQAEAWQTYTNPEIGLSIQYPPDWTQTEIPPSQTMQAIALEWSRRLGRIVLGDRIRRRVRVRVHDSHRGAGPASHLLQRGGQRRPALGADQQGVVDDFIQRPGVHQERGAGQRRRGPGGSGDLVLCGARVDGLGQPCIGELRGAGRQAVDRTARRSRRVRRLLLRG